MNERRKWFLVHISEYIIFKHYKYKVHTLSIRICTGQDVNQLETPGVVLWKQTWTLNICRARVIRNLWSNYPTSTPSSRQLPSSQKLLTQTCLLKTVLYIYASAVLSETAFPRVLLKLQPFHATPQIYFTSPRILLLQYQFSFDHTSFSQHIRSIVTKFSR